MCGRYFLHANLDQLTALFGEMDSPALAPRYNISPSQAVPVVRQNALGRREMVMLRWGLVPAWSKGPDSRYNMINARAETVAGKPAYRAAYKYRRCLLPASGFYEWQARGRTKQPYVLRPAAGQLLALAGIWEDWLSPDGDELSSCAIIVCAADAQVRPVHDRMPLLIQPEDFGLWLDRRVQHAAQTAPLLAAASMPGLTIYPVSPAVNNPRHDTAALTEPLQDEDASDR